jgi:hypothetical protein
MITRRTFLLASVAAAGTAAAAYLARPYLSELVVPQLDTAYPLGELNDAQMRNIVALGETVAAPEAMPPANFFRDHVNEITTTQKGLLKEFQRASATLSAASRRLFARDAGSLEFKDLPLARRDKVLGTLLWQYSDQDFIVRKIEKIVAARDALALRFHVMSPLINYYYHSPFGWAVVGYDSSPGRPPRDPRAYTKQPGYERAL